jgi:hypothetical protein
MKKKPYIFMAFKLVGVIGVIIFVIGAIKIFTGFGNFENNNFMIGSFMLPIGLFLSVFGFIQGFKPEITKQTLKTTKFIQEENEDELQQIITKNAEIHSEAITSAAKAVKSGLNETMYCKHCGEKIDIDSQFCKHCGNKL